MATRSEMYSTIKENGWAAEFQAKFGKNFTQGKTIELEEFIVAKGSDNKEDAKNKETKEITEGVVSKQAFIKLVTALQSESCIDAETAKELLELM